VFFFFTLRKENNLIKYKLCAKFYEPADFTKEKNSETLLQISLAIVYQSMKSNSSLVRYSLP